MDSDEGFQTLEIQPSPIGSASWPRVFEEHLHAMPPKALCEELKQQILKTSDSSPPRRSKRKSHQQHSCKKIPQLEKPWQADMKHRTAPASSTNVITSANTSAIQTANPVAALPTRQKDYIQISGSGRDLERFECAGILHNLPPQSGIPGWQRLSMMKFWHQESSSPTPSLSSSPSSSLSSDSSSTFATSSTTTTTTSSVNSTVPSTGTANPFGYASGGSDGGFQHQQHFLLDERCWCYEGVVLPGGKIVLGRWWHPFEDPEERRSLGPFVFWNVPEQ